MYPYMPELKKKLKKLCDESWIMVDHIRVRNTNVTIFIPEESHLGHALKIMPQINKMIDEDGAGPRFIFDGLTDTWTERVDYKNTKGFEARVCFCPVRWGK